MERPCIKFEIVGYIDDRLGEKQYHVYKHNQHKYIKSELVEFNIYKLKDDGAIITRETYVSFDDCETVENVVKEFIKYQNDKNVILAWSKEQKRILYIPRTNICQYLNINILKNINFVYHDYNSALEQDKKLSNS